MVNALEAGAIVAVMAAVVGWFMVLRRADVRRAHALDDGLPGRDRRAADRRSARARLLRVRRGGRARDRARRRLRAPRPLASRRVTGTVQAFGLACGFLFLSLYGGVLAELEALLFGSFLGITREQVLRARDRRRGRARAARA